MRENRKEIEREDYYPISRYSYLMNQIYESLLFYNNIAISIYYASCFSLRCIKLENDFMHSKYKINDIIVEYINLCTLL